MQRNNTKKTRSKQAPRLYKRTYKQSPTPTKTILIALGGK